MRGTDRARAVEWRTVAIAVAVYGGWFVVTAFHAAIPLPLLVMSGGWLIAWQSSLQHETIHGHPTRVRWINDAIGGVPLSLWLPYRLYRRSHLAHHGARHITDPLHDPESRYRAGKRDIAGRLQATLLGQLVFGPPLSVARFLSGEAARVVREPRRTARDWAPHLLGVAVVLAWLHHVDFGVGTYMLGFVYPGIALTMLRSYAEHRADLTGPGRAAIVERGGLFAVLFLNNNLHAAHHEAPRLAWYELPRYHRRHRARFMTEGAPIYRSYGEIVRRFAIRAHDDMLHPRYRPGYRDS